MESENSERKIVKRRLTDAEWIARFNAHHARAERIYYGQPLRIRTPQSSLRGTSPRPRFRRAAGAL